MRSSILALAGLATVFGCGAGDVRVVPAEGEWRGWLESPGGTLPFALEVSRQSSGIEVAVINGRERIEIPRVEWSEQGLVLGIDHYDSIVTADLSENGRRVDGVWRRTAGPGETTEMTFHATAGGRDRFERSEYAARMLAESPAGS